MTVATKTNERPGTRAQVRHVRMSASKARVVLDIVRGLPVGEAADVLTFTERGASEVIARCLASAVANAQHNDELDPETLYVSACYADEGPTLKRWRPRARGRATRIRKRTCHITLIVSRMDPRQLEQRQARATAAVGRGGVRRDAGEARRARVAKSQAARAAREAAHDHDHDHEIDEDAENENPAESEEAVEAAVEEAAAEAQAKEPEAGDASEEEK